MGRASTTSMVVELDIVVVVVEWGESELSETWHDPSSFVSCLIVWQSYCVLHLGAWFDLNRIM